jgi:hypothetical protein
MKVSILFGITIKHILPIIILSLLIMVCQLLDPQEGQPFSFHIINETEVVLKLKYSTLEFSDSLLYIPPFMMKSIYYKRFKVGEKNRSELFTQLMKSLYVYDFDSLIYYQDPCEITEWQYEYESQDWERVHVYDLFLDSMKLNIN